LRLPVKTGTHSYEARRVVLLKDSWKHYAVIQTSARIAGSLKEIPLLSSNDPKGSLRCINYRPLGLTSQAALVNACGDKVIGYDRYI
jgi:hypothetical protein